MCGNKLRNVSQIMLRLIILCRTKNRVANKTSLKGYVISTMVTDEKDNLKMKLT